MGSRRDHYARTLGIKHASGYRSENYTRHGDLLDLGRKRKFSLRYGALAELIESAISLVGLCRFELER